MHNSANNRFESDGLPFRCAPGKPRLKRNVLNQKDDQEAIEAKAIEAMKQGKISEKHQGINLVMENQKGNQGNQGH